MTQLRVWLQANEAAKDFIEKERFLTTIDERNIASGILRRQRDERPTSQAVDALAAQLKTLVARGRS
jgi:hypothetical protein